MLTSVLLAVAVQAAAPAAAPKSPSEIVAEAPATAWRDIPADDLMVMVLDGGERVTIQLIPEPFPQGHVDNIRALVAAEWWDGTSINRVQDNYVVQWGDATEKKALPAGLATIPESDYVAPRSAGFGDFVVTEDAYAPHAGFKAGFPVAWKASQFWPVHCYAMVGVGRNLSPDTGTGAELYAVIGHAPRHLDRNIALVGRVIDGIEHLSSLPRGTGALGFYENPAKRVAIESVRIGAEGGWQYLDTASPAFAAYAEARANRRDAFFNVPAGGADVCNIPVPIRRKP